MISKIQGVKVHDDIIIFSQGCFWSFFGQILTLYVLEKLKNSNFEIQIVPQSLNINNFKTANAKSINLCTIRKLTKYSLKHIL